MLLPAIVDIHHGVATWRIFFYCSMFTVFTGGIMMMVTATKEGFNLGVKEGFLLTSLTWIILSLFAALPFYISDMGLSITNSVFEAVSGITTTGSTILTNLDNTEPGILTWRALLQWLGGIGIIVTAMSLFPFLKVGGMQLFKTESSENEKALPRATQLAATISIIYFSLTFLCAFSYWIAGLSMFDSILHAMTTIATGGFSTRDASIGAFEGTHADLIAVVFILMSALPFVLYIKALRGDPSPLWKDSQVKTFLGIILSAALLLGLYNVLKNEGDIYTSLRDALFQVTVIISGTGYGIHDVDQWGVFATVLIFLLMFIGGCSGSTTCSVKVFRYQILFFTVKNQIKKLVHPSGVFPIKYNGKPVSSDVPISVAGFVFLYFITFAVLALMLLATGLDPLTALSGAATSISNVGPGLGPIIGPHGTFAPLPDLSKWILIAGMLLGRLELFTFFVLIMPQFWRDR